MVWIRRLLRTHVRRKLIGEADARLMLRQGLRMVSYCSECAEEVILSEANTNSLTFYDATYVACARLLGYDLYTRDGEILKNCPDVARPIASA